ncbi:HK97-gp10 family putative phage morphogenesis protein [Halalkalibacterium halodurans]|uniref:Phage protein, HK97 gp10 family n=1 Tax=Halalkalibacterium halodurans TaxID=86665 RepID=A0A0M0KI38_ALKHA|nr:HK97-gp10 family putative phage morphogenesis protein [Halalkalibacterium halodurans]MDY7222086.1 HK97-gp10 family putative phage morphogenesis protein [Halalkalibacterium halodurans]MDY7243895.1 HK97-gp10 family putative phage morphogenesis protein [Halalkalibacterium halodurans]TPE68021.1 hypothetical protein AMD02_015785 [Halalkalibacterium halodurans]
MMEFEGFDELMNNLRSMGDRGKAIEDKAVKKGAEHLEKKFEQAVYSNGLKRRTGKGGESITHEVRNGEAFVGPGKDGFYLKFPELGFYNTWAKRRIRKPWMQPTFERERVATLKIMADEAKKELRL